MQLRLPIELDGTVIPAWQAELPDDAFVVRIGVWLWWRDTNGRIHERVLPDFNAGPVGDGELEALLRGECRD